MIVGYPTPGKGKARVILDAFCAGAGGRVAEAIPPQLHDGAAAFYGITEATRHLWEQARAEGRDWVYLDNAYFDGCRQPPLINGYFRATFNRLQHPGTGVSDGQRLAQLIKAGLVQEPRPWRFTGAHIVVAPQSAQFMKTVAGYAGNWVEDIHKAIRAVTTRQITCRPWTADKVEQYRQLKLDLRQARAVVTYSSGCAVTAILEGVPAFVMGQDAISRPVAFTDLRYIEKGPPPQAQCLRRPWMEVVADNQWTLDEMRSGLCWNMLNA
jgi:hypothetical protein